jgi:hypothetical protein
VQLPRAEQPLPVALVAPHCKRPQWHRRLAQEPEPGQPEVDTLAAGSLAPGDPIEALRWA